MSNIYQLYSPFSLHSEGLSSHPVLPNSPKDGGQDAPRYDIKPHGSRSIRRASLWPNLPKKQGERGALCAEVSTLNGENGEHSAQRFLPKNQGEREYSAHHSLLNFRRIREYSAHHSLLSLRYTQGVRGVPTVVYPWCEVYPWWDMPGMGGTPYGICRVWEIHPTVYPGCIYASLLYTMVGIPPVCLPTVPWWVYLPVYIPYYTTLGIPPS